MGRCALRALALRLPGSEIRLIWLGRVFDDGSPHIVRTAAGFQKELCISDYIERRIFYTGRYERAVEAIVNAALGPNATRFLDVRANGGYVTLLGATRLSGRGHVHA